MIADTRLGGLRRYWRSAGRNGNIDVAGLTLLLVALYVVFSIQLPGRFATRDTLVAMMFQLPELGVLALAMLLPLISGGFNLAIVATANMAGLAMAWLMTTLVPPEAAPGATVAWIFACLAAGFVLCLIVGCATGYLVATLNTHPILVTLGTFSVINGVCVWLTRGKPIAGFPESFQRIGSSLWLGIPLPFWIFVATCVVVGLILTRTRFGISVYMLGSNLEATRFSGIDTRRVLIGVYAVSSLLCWLAAILMMARFNSASAGYAASYLLVTVLAAILGGVDPYGGFGRVSGLFVALLVLQVISSGLNLLGVNPQLTQASWGATLVVVLAVRRYCVGRSVSG